MSTNTDTSAGTTTAAGNEAIPTSEVATPVDTNTTPTDTVTPTTVSSTTLLTTSSTSSTFVTSSSTSSSSSRISSVDNPFTEIPPFFTASGAHPPFPTGTGLPFFFGDTSNGLSTGAKAGIGVGVAAIALAVAAFTLFILRVRKKENEWATNNAPPPPYAETGGSNFDMADMRPKPPEKPAEKRVPAPLMLSIGEASNQPSTLAPVTMRTGQRKSKASIRPRRNSNLAPVSEEEPELNGSSLEYVSEDGRASMSAPPTPRTPRTIALHALTGDSGAPSPMSSSFTLEPVPPLPEGNLSNKLGR